jgi:hypothetical protein
MGLFGLFSGKNKLPAIVEESTAAMKPQIEAARKFYSSAAAFDAKLASESTAAFLHGFIFFFASKHGAKSPELLWTATAQTFDQVFGSRLSGSIVMSLQRTLRDGTADHWISEGVGAAKYFDSDRILLLTSFLEGGAS